LATNLGLERLKAKCPLEKHAQLERLYKYFINTSDLEDHQPDSCLVKSSIFTFISSLFALIIEDTFYYGLLPKMTSDELAQFHNILRVVEAMNPYSFGLYKNWAKLFDGEQAKPYGKLQGWINEAQIRQAR